MKEKLITRNSEQLIPHFSLPSSLGKPTGPADFRQKKNLVMLFMDSWECGHCRKLLGSFAERSSEYRMLNTVIMAIAPAALPEPADMAGLGPDIILLADEDHKVLDTYSRDNGARPPFLVVADRYGAFYARMVLEAHEEIDHREVESILDFLENQCPECGVSRGDVAM